MPGACEPLRIAFPEGFAGSSIQLSLFEGTGTFYSDAACTTPVTSVTGTAGTTLAIYIRSAFTTAIAVKADAGSAGVSYSVIPVAERSIQPAYVWGQTAINKNIHLEKGLNGPLGVAVIGIRLYVSDYSNHRILYWNSIPTSNHVKPDGVLGQETLSTNDVNSPFPNAKSLFNPYTLGTDGTRLLVGEYNNNRVKIWNSAPTDNAPADLVLGAPGFHYPTWNYAGTTDKMTTYPLGARILNGKVVVADCYLHRVLIWNSVPTSNNPSPDVVLGQASGTATGANNGGLSASTLSCPSDLAWDGTYFYVADSNNHRVLVWNGFPVATGQPATIVLGQSALNLNTSNSGGLSNKSLKNPEGLLYHAGKLYVQDRGNGRVLAFDVSAGPTTYMTAGLVIGKPDFTTSTLSDPPTAASIANYGRMAISGTKFIYTDHGHHRVLIWNTIPATNGQSADVVLGQPGFVTKKANNGGVSGSLGDNVYGVATDGTNVALAVYGENRVLLWNSMASFLSGAAANVVLGQPSMSSTTANNGGVSASSLSGPTYVTFSNGRLIVCDYLNHRVLIWNSVPTANAQAANVVLGQSLMTTNAANTGGLTVGLKNPLRASVDSNGALYVADSSNHRIAVWTSVPASSGAAISFAVGQPNTGTAAAGSALNQLSSPYSARVIDNKLFVADAGNQRFLVFNTVPTASGATASFAMNTVTGVNGISNHSFSAPTDMEWDGSRFYAVDRTDKRVLVYDGLPTSAGSEAKWVLGRPNFVQNRTYPPAVDEKTEDPTSIAVLGGYVAVVEPGRSRVMIYDPSGFSASPTAVSTQIRRALPSSTTSAALSAATSGNYTNCVTLLAAASSAPDGYYPLDLDQNTATDKESVYCDMTNGGWMRIVDGADTPLTQLAQFGDVSGISSTFYSHPDMGIGWGSKKVLPTWDPDSFPCYHATKLGGAITRVKTSVGAYAEVSNNSFGYLYIYRQGWSTGTNFGTYLTANGFLNFQDAWSWSWNTGNNNLTFYPDRSRDVYRYMGEARDVAVEADYAATELHVCMSGENANYNPRYMKSLWVK